MSYRFLLTAVLTCSVLMTPVAARSDDDDLDRLRDAVARGDVLPLSVLQEKLTKAFPGEIIRVELDEDDGRFIYEFKVLQSSGRLFEIEMDARTGDVLDVDDDD
jgi:uncharacterized membrane protein YkoI